MAKPNYSFAKRQRELEKKNKKEEKRKQKAETKDDTLPDGTTAPDAGSDASVTETPAPGTDGA